MNEYLLMGSVYEDSYAAISDVRSRALDLERYTHEHMICADSLEEALDIFLYKHGEELDQLHGYIYMYLWTVDGWQRVTH